MGANAQHKVEGTRTKLHRRILKARCREPRVLKLPILVWQLSEVKNCSSLGNTCIYIFSNALFYISYEYTSLF